MEKKKTVYRRQRAQLCGYHEQRPNKCNESMHYLSFLESWSDTLSATNPPGLQGFFFPSRHHPVTGLGDKSYRAINIIG